MTGTEVIPFGKYKGQPVLAIMSADPGYMEWLSAQAWFAEKYRPIYNIVVNANPPSEMTPEHNSMQALFLDDAFCLKAVGAFKTATDKLIFESVKNDLNSHWETIRYGNMRMKKDVTATFDLMRDTGNNKKWTTGVTIQKRRMEHIADVWLTCKFAIEYATPIPLIYNDWSGTESDKFNKGVDCVASVAFELKPTIGDDYPAVMRQIKGQVARGGSQSINLLYRDFNASGVTESQMQKMFEESDIGAKRLDQI